MSHCCIIQIIQYVNVTNSRSFEGSVMFKRSTIILLLFIFSQVLFAQEKLYRIDNLIPFNSVSLLHNNLELHINDLFLTTNSLAELKQFYLHQISISAFKGDNQYVDTDEDCINLNKKDMIKILQFSIHREDYTISRIRHFLGVSQNILACILFVIQLLKYY